MFTKLIQGLNLTALLLSASVSLTAFTPASAATINTDIKVSHSELKAKCGRSGGTFTGSVNGGYRCVVRNSGSTTTVSCKGKRCVGSILPNFTRRSSGRWAPIASGTMRIAR